MEKTRNVGKHYIASYFKGQETNELAGFGDVFLREEYIDIFVKSGSSISPIRFSSNIERIVYAEQLLGKNARVSEDLPLPEVKFSSAINAMMARIKVEGVDAYMREGVTYMLDSITERQIKDSGISYTVEELKFYSEKGKVFYFSAIFSNRPENTPYLMRFKNFFEDRRNLLFKPKENLSPVFKDDNLDQLFILLGIYEPRMEKGKVYFLNDVGVMGDAVFIQYRKWDSEEYMLFRIAYGADSWANRTKDDIKNFFEKYKGYYFVTAEDIYDNMFDYMKVPSSEEPFPIYFEKIYGIDKERVEELMRMVKSGISKWNEIRNVSFFKPISKKFFPQRII
ncbi:MAG: hypothetical protein ACP5MX_02515 [Candidatus Micrarchaeia archaeon]